MFVRIKHIDSLGHSQRRACDIYNEHEIGMFDRSDFTEIEVIIKPPELSTTMTETEFRNILNVFRNGHFDVESYIADNFTEDN